MRACTKCGEVKPLEAFPPVRRGEAKLQTWCRDCFAAYGREYYRKNRDAQKARLLRNTAARRADNQRRMIEYLRAHPCVDCGETDIVVLQFDHVADKERNVGNMLSGGWTWHAIEKEIAKCEVRCANCHRLATLRRHRESEASLRTPRRQSRPEQLLLADGTFRTCRVCKLAKPLSSFPYRSRERGTRQTICILCQREVARAWYLRRVPKARRFTGYGLKSREELVARVDRYLDQHPCVDCGESNPALLDFDHLRDKTAAIASLVRTAASWKDVETEIEKCEVRCANCHVRKTARQFGFYRLGALTATRVGLEPTALTFVV
jgi:hypothetical protein